MADDAPWLRLLGDPLKDVTRKERRALLGVSVVALLVARTGVLPTKIESIGIDFTIGNKASLLLLLSAIVGYFLVMFLVYAVSDFVAWQKSYRDPIDQLKFDAHESQYRAADAGATNVVIGIEAVNRRKEAWDAILRRAIAPTSVTRAVMEFLVPTLVGVAALVCVLRAAIRG
jgi:hypothetical protein